VLAVNSTDIPPSTGKPMNLDPIATSSNLQIRNKAGFEPVSNKREHRVIRSTADTRDALR
jgi:hypothetical protein